MNRTLKKAISGVCASAAASVMLAGVPATPAIAAPSAGNAASVPINAYCDVTINVMNQWSSGYTVILTVRNISNVPVRWSRLDLKFPGPIFAVQGWNVSYTQFGTQATIVPTTGGVLNAGQSVTIGMISASGSVITPPQRELTCAPL